MYHRLNIEIYRPISLATLSETNKSLSNVKVTPVEQVKKEISPSHIYTVLSKISHLAFVDF